MMEQVLKQCAQIQNEFVQQWKSGGGRIMGYACTATPTEVIEAAGLLPYRIRALGNAQTEIADAHLSRFNCSFCRSCLQLGLDGTYDFLDGLIETNGCDHLRGMFENWQYVKKLDFFHYLRVPHVTDEDSLAYFEEDLRLTGKAVQEHFGVEITDQKLWEAIETQNRIREKLLAVYRMREREQPALTGVEALSLFLLGTAVAAKEFERILDRVIAEREGHRIAGTRARLLLGGSATDEIEFVGVIEDLGGHVVTDFLCYGSRAFWEVGERSGDDPYRELAEVYLKNLLCPRMIEDFPRRRDLVLSSVERAGADGVILVHNKFCDVHGVDNVQLRLALEKEGIAVLQLEKEYGGKADLGRMKTRVQAFMERIGER